MAPKQKKSVYDTVFRGLDADGIPREIHGDFYTVAAAYEMTPAIQHAVKKQLVLGKRSGEKSYETDIRDSIWSLERDLKEYKLKLQLIESKDLFDKSNNGDDKTE